jgi:hypothetical protein
LLLIVMGLSPLISGTMMVTAMSSTMKPAATSPAGLPVSR